MARPTTKHKGFLIPNAGDVAFPQMAEPDRIDFNTLGNARFAVIDGCEITVSGSTAINTAGMALVNGALVIMAGGQNADLGASGTQDRYDLVTVTRGGLLKVTQGLFSVNPVFPDPPTDATVLAAVFCPAGASSYVDNVIDKRLMIQKALLTKVDPTAPLVLNNDGTADLFAIDGSGTTTWAGDTVLQRTSAGTLKVSTNLNLDGDLSVGDAITAASLTATNKVSGSNLRSGPDDPNGPFFILANPGDLYQRTTGQLYINHDAVTWLELATVQSAIPVGTVISSLIHPSSMGAGWVPLDGHTVVQEVDVPSLFGIPALNGYITPGGSAGHHQMVMPDATKRVLMGDFLTAGTSGGGNGGSNSFLLTANNLPPHKHDVTVANGGGSTPSARTSPAGQHGHVTKPSSGNHGHNVNDPGHAHNGFANPINGLPGAAVALMWGGQNKIDAYFNDRSHTYSVEAMDWTTSAFTGIEIGETGSQHVHETETATDHTHLVTVDQILPHGHTVTETSVGAGVAVNYTPMYFSVYMYIRS